MSTFTSSRGSTLALSHITAAVGVANANTELLVSAWPSCELKELSAQLAATSVGTPEQLAQLSDLVSSAIAHPERLPAAVATSLSSALAQSRIVDGSPSTPPGLDAARFHLHSALLDATAVVASAERMLGADIIQLSLPQLGYFIEARADRNHVTAFSARRAHEVVVVSITDDGVVETDHAGLEGDECETRQDSIVQKLAENGLALGIQTRTHHDDSHGGTKIRAAERKRTARLADGVADVAELAYEAAHASPIRRAKRAPGVRIAGVAR